MVQTYRITPDDQIQMYLHLPGENRDGYIRPIDKRNVTQQIQNDVASFCTNEQLLRRSSLDYLKHIQKSDSTGQSPRRNTQHSGYYAQIQEYLPWFLGHIGRYILADLRHLGAEPSYIDKAVNAVREIERNPGLRPHEAYTNTDFRKALATLRRSCRLITRLMSKQEQPNTTLGTLIIIFISSLLLGYIGLISNVSIGKFVVPTSYNLPLVIGISFGIVA